MFLIMLITAWLILFLGSSFAVDRYLEYLHQFKNNTWVEIGRPRGMFFAPKGSSQLSSVKLSFSWHKELPASIREDKEAMKLHSKVLDWGKFIKWYAILFLPLVIINRMI